MDLRGLLLRVGEGKKSDGRSGEGRGEKRGRDGDRSREMYPSTEGG